MAPKIVLGTPQRQKQIVVYNGRYGAECQKYIDDQWITFQKDVPLPIPGHWATALKRLGYFTDYGGGTIPVQPVFSVVRNMGMGDVILATTTVTAMHGQWPWAKIRYYVEARYAPLFRHREQDFELHTLDEAVEGNIQFDLRGVSERNSDRFTVERIDIYARHAGVLLSDGERAPMIVTTEEERERGRQILMAHGWDGKTALIGIQPMSSRPERDLAMQTTEDIAVACMAKGWAVAVFHNNVLTFNGGIINMTGGTDVQTLIDCVSNCSLFIGVDSGITHMAGALGVRTLALTGPIRGHLRYACYPSVTVMQKDNMHCVQRPHECYSCRTGDPVCMDFTAEEIMKAMEGMK